eukprot:9396988-Pyramimonas_sp.AAC.1
MELRVPWLNIWGDLNSAVVEWLSKGVMAAWSPSLRCGVCLGCRSFITLLRSSTATLGTCASWTSSLTSTR